MEHEANLSFDAWLKTYDGIRTGSLAHLGSDGMLVALRLAFTAGYAAGWEESANLNRE